VNFLKVGRSVNRGGYVVAVKEKIDEYKIEQVNIGLLPKEIGGILIGVKFLKPVIMLF